MNNANDYKGIQGRLNVHIAHFKRWGGRNRQMKLQNTHQSICRKSKNNPVRHDSKISSINFFRFFSVKHNAAIHLLPSPFIS